MPYFICPNCRRRVVDDDGLENLTNERVGCSSCGFGFLFELMDDYYPAPGTGFVVCDQGGRILAAGRGVFELTGCQESELLGRELQDVLGLEREARRTLDEGLLERLEARGFLSCPETKAARAEVTEVAAAF